MPCGYVKLRNPMHLLNKEIHQIVNNRVVERPDPRIVLVAIYQ